MKQLLIVVFALILSLPAFSQQRRLLNKLDRDKGLGQLKIGTKKKKFHNLIRTNDNSDNLDWFEKENDTITYKGIKLYNIRYGFLNDEVFSIAAQFDSANSNNLKKILRSLYGGERERYSSGWFTHQEKNGKRYHGVSTYHSHDDWPGNKIHLGIFRSNWITLQLVDAEKIKRKTYREQEKEEWKKQWKEEDDRSFRRELKREFREHNRIQSKEDKEEVEYQMRKYKQR